MHVRNAARKALAVAILVSLGLSACTTAVTPTVAPTVITKVYANPDLRIDSEQLWVDWAQDGQQLVFVARPRRLMLLSLGDPGNPRQVSEKEGHSPRFSPGGLTVAFVGRRLKAGRTSDTIYLQRLDRGERVDLLPTYSHADPRPGRGWMSIHRWVDPTTISFDEALGTGIHQLALLDVPQRHGEAQRDVSANIFRWSPAGSRVAGQWFGHPSRFWIWDREERVFLRPDRRQSGRSQWFETWSPAGDSALFTEWQGEHAYGPETPVALYRLNVTTGRTEKLAENAVLADWSGHLLAYIKLGITMTLVVADAKNGRVLWMDDLGEQPDQIASFPWEYRPVFAGPYLFYRAGDGSWRVSWAEKKQVRLAYAGGTVNYIAWSPGGQHGAFIDNTGWLWVIRNPLVLP